MALVVVDERSLGEGGRWPWPRDRVAELLDRVGSLGAAAIGLDILFAEPDSGGDAPRAAGTAAGGAPALSARDAALAAALGRGPFVIGYAFTFDRPVDRPCHLRSIGLGRAATVGALAQVPRAAGVLCSLDPLGTAAAASGFMNASADADGILRRMPQIVEFGGEIYPSLALAAVRTGLAVQRLGIADSTAGWPALWLGDREIPLDADGSVLVRFGDPAGGFPRFSAVDVLQDRVPAGALAGRIVFVGVSALGLGDVVATPLGTFLPGAEVHATVADNLLRGDFVRRPQGGTVVELALVLGVVGGGGPERRRARVAVDPAARARRRARCCGSARDGSSARAAGTSRPCSRGSRSPGPWASPRCTGWSPSARAPTRATASSGPRARWCCTR